MGHVILGITDMQTPYAVMPSAGYGQTGRGNARTNAGAAAPALRSQQGQYVAPAQGAMNRGGPQAQRITANGQMVQNQAARAQQMVRFLF